MKSSPRSRRVLDFDRATPRSRFRIKLPLERERIAVRVGRAGGIEFDLRARRHRPPQWAFDFRNRRVIGLAPRLDAPIQPRAEVVLQVRRPSAPACCRGSSCRSRCRPDSPSNTACRETSRSARNVPPNCPRSAAPGRSCQSARGTGRSCVSPSFCEWVVFVG